MKTTILTFCLFGILAFSSKSQTESHYFDAKLSIEYLGDGEYNPTPGTPNIEGNTRRGVGLDFLYGKHLTDRFSVSSGVVADMSFSRFGFEFENGEKYVDGISWGRDVLDIAIPIRANFHNVLPNNNSYVVSAGPSIHFYEAGLGSYGWGRKVSSGYSSFNYIQSPTDDGFWKPKLGYDVGLDYKIKTAAKKDFLLGLYYNSGHDDYSINEYHTRVSASDPNEIEHSGTHKLSNSDLGLKLGFSF